MAERILTGIKPTGQLTLGNYIGVLRNLPKMTERGECIFFIADLHALTLPIEPETLRQNSIDLASFYPAGSRQWWPVRYGRGHGHAEARLSARGAQGRGLFRDWRGIWIYGYVYRDDTFCDPVLAGLQCREDVFFALREVHGGGDYVLAVLQLYDSYLRLHRAFPDDRSAAAVPQLWRNEPDFLFGDDRRHAEHLETDIGAQYP